MPESITDTATGSRPVGRTALQVGTPGAIVTIGTWFAQLNRWDLDPGPGTDLPAEVAAAVVVIITTILAIAMNRKPKEPIKRTSSEI